MTWRKACIWSSWALLPMAALLLLHGSLLGLVYLFSAKASFAYHWHAQRRFSLLDHVLAWACIGVNCWLALRTHDWQATVAGACAVGLALVSYHYAHHPPPAYGLADGGAAHYDEHHTVWHFWCGVAGWLLAWGYVA